MLSRRSFATAESIIALIVGLVVTSGAIAADLAPMPTKAIIAPTPVLNPWTYSATAYGWVPLMNGSVTVKGRTADVDVDYSDIWKIVKESEIPKDLAAFMGSFEARNDRFSVFADIVYLKIALDANMTRTRSVDDLNLAVSASAGFQEQLLIAELAAAYQVAHWGSNATRDSGTALDVFGGGRLWWMQADASLAVTATLSTADLSVSGGKAIAKSGDVDWVDPLVGLRLRHQFAPGLNLTVSGDVGGFDVGSKFSWQALGALNYDFFKSKSVIWSGMLGYRALYVDYTQGSGHTHFEYNMTMHGPILGVTARF
jgi:hypothetical protein